jgi:hypothetical protein
MKREIQLRNRILFLECKEMKACKIYDEFLDFLIGKEEEVNELMDDYEIPENVVLNFKEGSGELAGIYHSQKENVRKHVIVIDIYTKYLGEEDLEELVDTFIHEIIHHKIEDDKEVDKIAKGIVGKLMKN